MATVGERIKEVREAKGWTQERLASEAEISKSFLSEVEKHGKNISLDLLLKVATALGASVGYLASGEGSQPGERKPVMIPMDFRKQRKPFISLTLKRSTFLRRTVRSLRGEVIGIRER